MLCLDEPLAGLDWRARSEVVTLLADLRKERAIVVVSHDVEEISPVTDRAFRMGKGGVLTPAPELALAGGTRSEARRPSFHPSRYVEWGVVVHGTTHVARGTLSVGN